MNYFDFPNLASPQLGSKIVFATDEWFAAAENVIKDDEPVWKEDLYTPFGKWMDGWESRRRRTEGHDWCIIQLGLQCRIHAIEVNTAYFTGNFSPKVSIQACSNVADESVHAVEELIELRKASIASRPEFGRMGLKADDQEWSLVEKLHSQSWDMIVPLQPLGAGYPETRKTVFNVATDVPPVTFIRLNMGPDGGIARIRIYGEVIVNPEKIPSDKPIDLLAIENGGMAISCSNKHYGHPRNLVAPGRGNCMGDGWETARQPNRPPVYTKGPDGLMVLPGYDWAILQLGVNGEIHNLEVDTNFYTGNYPESCQIEACKASRDNETFNLLSTVSNHAAVQWVTLLPRTRLGPGQRHFFSLQENNLKQIGTVSHLKITIFPDGGIMRVRAFGKADLGNAV